MLTFSPNLFRVLSIALICTFFLTFAQASAHATQRSHTNVYKKEVHIDLNAHQTKAVHLACNVGDRVTDGSIRIDHVDQDTGTLLSVKVLESYSVNPNSYRFVVENTATGRAQAKGFVTCIARSTHSDNHLLIGFNRVHHTEFVTAHAQEEITLHCAAGFRPVAVGYDTHVGFVRPTYSEPVGTNGWRMRFRAEANNSQVTMSMRCLRQQTANAMGHSHMLLFRHIVKNVTLAPHQTISAVVECGEKEKGILASYSLGNHVRLLGHDPQPKHRVFRLMNTSNQHRTVKLDLVCLNNRTSLPL